jgi:probable phosphoglycerate mutase
MPKHFYIFRHGQCPLNVTNHIQGQRFNGSLTPEGRKQATKTGENLKNKNISIIISSPMKRAMQTAKIVADIINVPILIDSRFIEVNMGIVEGMHINYVEKKFPELYFKWRHDKSGTARFAGGENKFEVRTRILDGLNHYSNNTRHQNIGISSHGIAISQIMQYLGIPCSNVPNGAILHISHPLSNWQYHELIN